MQESAPADGEGGVPVGDVLAPPPRSVEVAEPEPQHAFKHVRYNTTLGRTCGRGYTLIDSYSTCLTAARWTNAMPVDNRAYSQTIDVLGSQSRALPRGCIKQNFNHPDKDFKVYWNVNGNASSTNDQWDVICQQRGACVCFSPRVAVRLVPTVCCRGRVGVELLCKELRRMDNSSHGHMKDQCASTEMRARVFLSSVRKPWWTHNSARVVWIHKKDYIGFWRVGWAKAMVECSVAYRSATAALRHDEAGPLATRFRTAEHMLRVGDAMRCDAMGVPYVTVTWTLVFRQNATNLTAASSWFPDPPAEETPEGAPDPWFYNAEDISADTFNVLALMTDGRFDNPEGMFTAKMVWPDVPGLLSTPLTLSSTWRQANIWTNRYVACIPLPTAVPRLRCRRKQSRSHGRRRPILQ